MQLKEEVANTMLRPVKTEVGCRCMSKISTPWRMAATMVSLEDWNASSSSGDHENWQQALRCGLKGAMMLRSW